MILLACLIVCFVLWLEESNSKHCINRYRAEELDRFRFRVALVALKDSLFLLLRKWEIICSDPLEAESVSSSECLEPVVGETGPDTGETEADSNPESSHVFSTFSDWDVLLYRIVGIDEDALEEVLGLWGESEEE